MSVNSAGSERFQWKLFSQVVTLYRPSLSLEVQDNQNQAKIVPRYAVKGLPNRLLETLKTDHNVFIAFCKAVYPQISRFDSGYSIEFLGRLVAGGYDIPPFEKSLMNYDEQKKFYALIKDPEHLCCSISHQIFERPVFDEAGNTYEEHEIKKWFEKNPQNLISPLTGEKLQSANLIPNKDKKRDIEAWKDQILKDGQELIKNLIEKNCVQSASQLLDRLEKLRPDHPQLVILKEQNSSQTVKLKAAELERQVQILLDKIYPLEFEVLKLEPEIDQIQEPNGDTYQSSYHLFSEILSITVYNPVPKNDKQEKSSFLVVSDTVTGEKLSKFNIQSFYKNHSGYYRETIPGGVGSTGSISVPDLSANSRYGREFDEVKFSEVCLIQDAVFIMSSFADKSNSWSFKSGISVACIFPKQKETEFRISFSGNSTSDSLSVKPVSRDAFMLRQNNNDSYYKISDKKIFEKISEYPEENIPITFPKHFDFNKIEKIENGFQIKSSHYRIFSDKLDNFVHCLVENPFNKTQPNCYLTRGYYKPYYQYTKVKLCLKKVSIQGKINYFFELIKVFLEQHRYDDITIHLKRLIYSTDFSKNWEQLQQALGKFSSSQALQAYWIDKISEYLKTDEKTEASKLYLFLGLFQPSNESALEYYKKSVALWKHDEALEALNYALWVKEGALEEINSRLIKLIAAVPEAKQDGEMLMLALRAQQSYLLAEVDQRIRVAFHQYIKNAENFKLPSIPSSQIRVAENEQTTSIGIPEKSKT